MLKILQKDLDLIVEQARKEAPLEACGYLAGKDGAVTKVIPMTNADASSEHFSFLPKEQFAALKKARAESLSLIGVYHSHPASPARPSEEDIRLALDPTVSYLIVSLASDEPIAKSFIIIKGIVEIEKLEVSNDTI